MTASLDEREIVVAFVSPVGAPTESTLKAFETVFKALSYTVVSLRISLLLESAVPQPRPEGMSRLGHLMNLGDAFRERIGDDAACAYMAASAINLERKTDTGDAGTHRPKTVTLLRSLKTPDEVKVLRQIYGQRLVVVGLSVSREQRRKELVRQLKDDMLPGEAATEASRLLERDEHDESVVHGQRMRDAFALSDAFLKASTKPDKEGVQRLVHLLMGDPWQTPTRDEQGMFHAWSAKFRSSAAGRQVGAAIVDDLGEVVALGSNDVPRPHGGQYWPDHKDDRRDFQLKYDANARGKYDTARELLNELAKAGWLSPTRKDLGSEERVEAALGKGGPLAQGRFSDLIEYGRIVHAEMAALMTAARQGRAVRGCTLYTTTFPCHECARLIIAAGIVKVVYVDPYLKSLAPDLYEDMFEEAPQRGSTSVAVEPFAGVSPRMFARAFELSNRRKNLRGDYEEWEVRQLITLDEAFGDAIPDWEASAGAYLAERLKETASPAGKSKTPKPPAKGTSKTPVQTPAMSTSKAAAKLPAKAPGRSDCTVPAAVAHADGNGASTIPGPILSDPGANI